MITVEKYFEEKINDLLLSCTNKTLYFFKGFSKEQILYLSKHEKCVLGYNEIIAKDDEENIDILRINDKWLEIIQNISNSDCALIGFYEELIAIKDFLPRIEVDNIVIIENNLLEPWQPIYISPEKAIELFDFFREDKEPVNKEINILSQYYGDVRILNKENILILPVTVDNEQIKHIPFWTNRTIEHVEYSSTEKIEFNSDEDWLFRLKITNGIRESVTYLCEDDKAIQTMDISAALSSLKIPFCIESKNKIKKSKHYNYDRFTPILKKYWGEEAQFRDLSFYKDPDRSYETEEISQGNIIAEIVQQCEDAYFGKNFCNIFITAPTGAGKSLLFQLPSIYMAEQYSTITIVISPLIALMNDQVIQLRQERNVSIAACINSTMTIEERISVTEKIKNGEISLLYLAPELLLTTHLQTFLGGRKIGLLVIDEAHTVTSWGRDFRADYWFLGDFLKKLKRDNMSFPVLCLTATAVYSGEDDVVNDTTPRVRIEIKYKEQFEIVAEKAEGIMNAVVNILTEFKNSESKQFTAKMFEERLNELIGEKTIQHDKISLLLDIFIESVDENAMYSRQRSQIRVIRQRKQSNHDETVYFVSNSAYTRLTSYFNKMLEQCKPNIDNDVFCRFYSLRKDKSIELMPILRMLELLNLASYEIRGGEKAEVFIRINDPSKIQRLANGNYKNTLLQSIRSKHKRNEILLNAFFMSDIDNETRWHLIEDYFLGNEDAVRDILQLSEDDI